MSGKYIVMFKDSATEADIQKYAQDIGSNGGAIHNTYDSVVKGFSASIPEAYFQTLQASLGSNSPIDIIEPDGIVTTQ
ncbi:protease propeptide/inhibitor [Cristinia sonorae]|uniref:Protease propeptide/inhibitor n=1 Tax=Cristinia sonorae TaxID=1940300 RepID=A0A8K0UF21_9AGAR|nr:protease propeptide/inhibitor [Cristinia sonorae]